MARTRSPQRVVAAGAGGVFVAFGIASLVAGGLAGTAIGPGSTLLAGVLGTTVLLGAVTVASGAALLAASSRGVAVARIANIVAGVAWLAIGYAGLFVIGTPANVLGMNGADNALLFAASTAQLAVGLGARREPASASDGRRPARIPA